MTLRDMIRAGTSTGPLTSAPTLRTERLILRGPERGDLGALTSYVTTSPRLALVGGLGSADDAWRSHLKNVGHWHWHGYGFFTLTSPADDAPLGRVGLLNDPGYEAVELAWHLFDGAEEHGYATEAATAIRDWARRDRDLGRIVSYIDPAITRSQSTARRLGAATDGTRAAHDASCDVWTHPA